MPGMKVRAVGTAALTALAVFVVVDLPEAAGATIDAGPVKVVSAVADLSVGERLGGRTVSARGIDGATSRRLSPFDESLSVGTLPDFDRKIAGGYGQASQLANLLPLGDGSGFEFTSTGTSRAVAGGYGHEGAASTSARIIFTVAPEANATYAFAGTVSAGTEPDWYADFAGGDFGSFAGVYLLKRISFDLVTGLHPFDTRSGDRLAAAEGTLGPGTYEFGVFTQSKARWFFPVGYETFDAHAGFSDVRLVVTGTAVPEPSVAALITLFPLATLARPRRSRRQSL